MLKSSVCDCSDPYVLVTGTVSIANTTATDLDANNDNKQVIVKNCAPFQDCIIEINNTQVDNTKKTLI